MTDDLHTTKPSPKQDNDERALLNKQHLHEELEWEHPISEEEGAILKRTSLLNEFWRAFKIFMECIRGFIAFRTLTNCVTVFGSARFKEDHKYYIMARRVGQLLAQRKMTVMTGGGPGLMEAANRGAKDSNGYSVGCNIYIPLEQDPNTYLDKWITFKYFFVRKVMLSISSRGFIVMPGGFGTLDEFFEMSTLIQTQKIEGHPIVLMGVDYWQPLIDFMHQTMAKQGTIDIEDVQKILLTDSPEEAIHYIRHYNNSAKQRTSESN